ncbi:MAG: DUF3854 domain-containing protein [Okeania sp. SIO2C9]|uniref:DUF3854 domain-containing protein n=1 Tax=Okeania sp. SIO2C9 TaxID=2607791 RepID=UPI0013C017CB|nr:DUF3854 domain-containing protein [Okeania sp. SIO2C9]NEQ77930.1 DUF3854 domain-containing protein [Okeania sp. SIO2C9]
MNINQTHLAEWVIKSAVLQEIVNLNVHSINKVEGYSPSSLLFDLLHPNPKRINSGRLDASGVRQFDNCLETSGWWVSGIDPFTWEVMEWGRFKPDPDTPLSKAYFNHKSGKEEKAPKYRSPAGIASRLVLLQIFDQLWEKISQRYGIPISAEEKQHLGGFWHWVLQHPEIPIILVEGEKKAGCLLSLGYVAIPLPGIWMARRYDDFTKINESLIPDLALFAQEKRPVKIIFDHDVKLKTKINVYKATVATAKLLAKSGCKVRVGMLPSMANGKNAIDDYVVAGGDIGQIISSAIAWESYRDQHHPNGGKVISKQEWWEKIGLVRGSSKLAKFVGGKIQKLSPTVKPEVEAGIAILMSATDIKKQNASSSAITLWKPPLKLGRPYIEYTGPGSIPTYSEYKKLLESENWLIKEPEIRFDLRVWGDAPMREAYAKGWTLILDKHDCGEGKSHVYGSLKANKLEGIERTVFAATNHRNPTVESVEHRKDLIAKHSGLTYDYSKKTPLDNPHQVPTPSGTLPDVKPPCVEHKLFKTAYELQLNAFSGKGSKICQTCPKFKNGCEYLEERQNTLGTEKIKDENGNVIGEIPNHPDIRADLNGLNKFDVPTALIVDEIDQTLEPSKPIRITQDAIARGNMKLASLENQKLAKVLQEICQKIYALIDNYEPANKHGSDHFQVMEKLAEFSIPKNEWLSSEKKYLQYLTYIAKDKFNAIIEEIYSSELVNPQINLWGESEYIYKVNHDPITREITTVEEKPTGEILPTIPSLDNLIAECQKLLKTNFDEIIDSGMTPGEKTEALELNHTLDFLSPILKVINGYRKVSLSLNKNCLTITKPWYRHQDIIKSAAVVTFLDTTQDVADLRRNLNLDKDEPILVFSSPEKDHSNLTLKFITDFGHASNQRRNGSQYTETERITAFINQIAENHKGEKIGLIDYKAHAYSHKLPDNIVKVGHWGNDSRGSNQFLDCTAMIAIGDYTENLGALAAKWQCTTGQIVTPSKLTGDYGRHVKRRRIADLEQVIGRLRVTNRPDEQLTIYLPGKWKEDETRAIASKLPGVDIEKVATYDLCQKAARKGQQSQRKIIETFWDLITSEQDITQEQIAKIVGLSRGRVAQICKDLLPTSFVRFKKMLVMLWNNLSKTNIPEKALSELPEDVGWFVEKWLPNFHEYVQQGETLEEVAQNIELAIEFHGKQILDYVSVDTIIDLIKLFMAPMPISFWEELRSQREPIPI